MNENKCFIQGYIGTYYSEKSRGIYRFSFCEENGEVTEPELFYEAHNAKWVSLYSGRMAFPIEKGGRAGICVLMLEDGKVQKSYEMLKEEHTPCYILQDERHIYTANYHEGTVMVYDLEDGKPRIAARIENGTKAGCHQVLFHGSYIMVPCLEQDRIRIFEKGHDFTPAGEIHFPQNSGPRHGIFNKDHDTFYVVSEWSNELFVFTVNGIEFGLTQTLSLTKKDNAGLEEKAAAAAIHLSKDERFLYISVRGLDYLAVVDVSRDKAALIQRVPCGGQHPRDFILSGNEEYVLIANRMGGGLVSIKRDRGNGLAGGLASRVSMPEGVSLVLNDRK